MSVWNKLTQKEVLKRFKKVHGDEYDYSLVEYVNNRKNTICEVSDLSGLEVWEFIKLVDEVKFHYPDYDIKNLYNFSGVEVYKKRRSTKNLEIVNNKKGVK